MPRNPHSLGWPGVRVFVVLAASLLAACTRHYPPAPVVAGGGQKPGSAARGEEAHPDSIVIAPGDTLYGIARRYDVPLRSLIEANHLSPPFQLVIGQHLVVPQVRQYVVQPGDSLNGVARKLGLDASSLARANNLASPYHIQTGQALILPAPIVTAAAGSAPVTTLPVVAAAPSPAAPAVVIQKPPPPSAPQSPASLAPPVAPSLVPPARTETTIAATPPLAVPRPEPVKPAEVAPPRAAEQQASLPPPAAAPPANPPHTGLGFQWPVRGSILVGYGPGASGTQNDGINIAAAPGSVIAAANDGVVAYAGNELRGFGNLILIKHADGWTTAYAHCESLLVKRGDRVRRGQAIAKVGQTGAVSEPQLHFEIRRGTQPLDPVSYLPPVSTAAAARGAG